MKSKSSVCYALATLVLDPVLFLYYMIHKVCYEPYVKTSLLVVKLSIERFLRLD